MELHRSSLVGLLVLVLLQLSTSNAQLLSPPSSNNPKTKPPSIQLKEMIERHFESIQPRPRPQFDGAIPGIRLLDQRSIRAEEVQNRFRTSLTAVPEATGSSTVMPGIQLRPALPAGLIPTTVVTGDFNQDGHMDFVIANGAGNDLWLYLGKGDGTFQLPQVIPLSKGLTPLGVATGDLRGNGKLDLVVAEADTSTVGVLLGNGDGTFGYEQEYALPQQPEAVVVSDFNHDGRADIAVAMDTTASANPSQIPYIALLVGDGTGSFGTPRITSMPTFTSTAWNLAAGDVNNDGLPDLLLTGPGSENSQIYINNGDGTFRSGAIIIRNNAGISAELDGQLGDVNGDGCLDAVVADAYTPVWVSLGDCSGNFATPVATRMGDSNSSLRLVDVNGDGHLDIVTASIPALVGVQGAIGGNVLSVAFGDGKGSFSAARSYVGEGQAYSLAFADFNGDGKPDFVTANNDTDSASVYQNDGSGGFGFPQGIYAGVPGQQTINAPISGVSFADLNGDGKVDLLFLDVGMTGEYYVTAFLNDGTGRLTGPISSDVGVQAGFNNGANTSINDYRLGDFRNTGHQDMIAVGGQYLFFLRGNSDGTFAKGSPLTTTGAGGLLTVGDFNRDGKLDFATVNGSGAMLLNVFLGNGDGTFGSGGDVYFSDPTNMPNRVYTGDFKRDGKLDILVLTDKSSVWEFDGNGDGTFQTGLQLYTGFQPFALADVNGDGLQDIARYNFTWPNGPPTFTTYLGQADGTFRQSSTYAPYLGIPEIAPVGYQSGDPLATSLVADLNGDGKPDEVAFQAAGLGGSEKYAQILMGNGDGTFQPTYDVFPFYLWSYPLYAHDLDNDGKADMVDLIGGTSSVRVFKGAAAPALQIALVDEIVNGNASCGYVFLNVASNSSTSVTLSSSISGVVLPSSVVIPANTVGAQFCYSLATNYNWRQVFDINAQLNGETATAYAADSYSLGFSVALSPVSPSVIYSSQSTNPVTVTVTSTQGYSSVAKLYCQGMFPGDSCQFASGTLGISLGGPATTTVTFVMAADAAAYGYTHPFTVVVDDGNVIQRQSTTVTVAPLYLTNVASVLQSSSPGTATSQMTIIGIPPYTLACSGLPTGATCSFSGSQLAYPSVSTMTLTISVPSGAVPGNYPVQVTVTSGPEKAIATTTLQVIGFSVQGPSAGNDWALAGSQQYVAISANANVTETGSFLVNCALDVGGTCSGGYAAVSQTAQTVKLAVSPPAGSPTGQHVLTVTVIYGTLSQSFTFPFTITDFSGTLTGSTATLTRGGSSTLTATLNATAGFTDPVALACNGTTQVTCSFSPATVQLTGGTPQAVSVTLTAGASASAPSLPLPFISRKLLALAALLPLGISLGLRRWRTLFLISACFVLLLPVVSCGSGGGSQGGGGGSGGGGGGGGTGGSNSYTVTVTASVPNSGVMRTLGTVNVTVNH